MDINNFLRLLDNGYSLDHIYILSLIEKGEDVNKILNDKKGKLLFQALTRKKLLENNHITPLGLTLINLFNNIKIEPIDIPISEVIEKPLSDKEKLENYIDKLHKSLGDKLLSLIGKKQIMGYGNTYFIPSKGELKLFIPRFIKHHADLWDEDKIEKLLHNHIQICARKKSYAPACKYFIYHDRRGSALASALENYEEETKEQLNVVTYEGTNI